MNKTYKTIKKAMKMLDSIEDESRFIFIYSLPATIKIPGMECPYEIFTKFNADYQDVVKFTSAIITTLSQNIENFDREKFLYEIQSSI